MANNYGDLISYEGAARRPRRREGLAKTGGALTRESGRYAAAQKELLHSRLMRWVTGDRVLRLAQKLAFKPA